MPLDLISQRRSSSGCLGTPGGRLVSLRGEMLPHQLVSCVCPFAARGARWPASQPSPSSLSLFSPCAPPGQPTDGCPLRPFAYCAIESGHRSLAKGDRREDFSLFDFRGGQERTSPPCPPLTTTSKTSPLQIFFPLLLLLLIP